MTPPKETTIIQPAHKPGCSLSHIEPLYASCACFVQPAPVEQDVERIVAAFEPLFNRHALSVVVGKNSYPALDFRRDLARVALYTLTPARAEGFKAGVEACKDKLKAIGFNNVDAAFADVTMEVDHG